MVDINCWKQGDIVEKLEVKPAEAKAFRDELLIKGVHWDKNGATIYWTDHAMWMFKKYLAEPVASKTEIEVFIVGPAQNPRFVYGDLDGTRIPIECSQKDSQRIVKKTVTVSVREENGEFYYSYNL